MKSGATYLVPLKCEVEIDTVEKAIITIKGAIVLRKDYPGTVVYSNGFFMVPLTQENTSMLAPAGRDVLVEIQFNFKDKSVAKSQTKSVHISGSLATDFVDGNFPTGYSPDEIDFTVKDGIIVAHVHVEEVDRITAQLAAFGSEMQRVTSECEEATRYAQTATETATQAGDYAYEKGDDARRAAEKATDAAGNADEAAGRATSAAADAEEKATAAAGEALKQASYAKSQGDIAKTATEEANTATDGADAAAGEALKQASYAKAQGDLAKTAAEEADTATELANTAADGAGKVTATLSKEGKVTTLIVTDRNGDQHTVQIVDGEKGEKGDTYTITEADYQAIAEFVEVQYKMELGELQEAMSQLQALGLVYFDAEGYLNIKEG